MSLPDEKARSLLYTYRFLRDLIRTTPRIPKKVREDALRVLRHFPATYELHKLAESNPSILDPKEFEKALKDQKLDYIKKIIKK